jgi:hypothetical protein
MALSRASLIPGVPQGLRDPLFAEYDALIQAYLEGRWTPAELSGGRFCEIVYTVILGYGSGNYAASPNKPRDFVGACRTLEQVTTVPRSFQILIPRILPALYEIRNNRGVGHAGGDVDPNFLDSTYVVSSARWVMAELIRVMHGVTVDEAQSIVNELATVVIPLVWNDGDIKRVLDPKRPMTEQILLLVASSSGPVNFLDLVRYIEPKTPAYLKRMVRQLHEKRLLEYSEPTGGVKILPPGANLVAKLVSA